MFSSLVERLRAEAQQLIKVNRSDRPWQMPTAAALAVGVPMLVGSYFGHMDYGLISSLGGLTFIYLPSTPLHHRMLAVIACAFAMASSYALGLMSSAVLNLASAWNAAAPELMQHLVAVAVVLTLTFLSIVVSMLCRFYQVGPPGSLFFVMAAAIGAYSPTSAEPSDIPLKVGLITLGCLLACIIAFVYSLIMLRRRPAQPITPLAPATFDFVVYDSVIIGLSVGLTLLLAHVFQLGRAYWAPVSCLAIIQGMSLRAMWVKQVHRVLGTTVGLFAAWGLLSLPFNNWTISLMMMALFFVMESLVVRHYGCAAIFITPITILLADAATLNPAAVPGLIEARFYDTALGCVIGFAGGFCLHRPGLRQRLGGWMKKALPKDAGPETP